MTPLNVLFLISGGGGTIKSFNEYLKTNHLGHGFNLFVIFDRLSPAVDYANNENIPYTILEYNNIDRLSLSAKIKSINPDVVITNIFKILDKNIVTEFRGKLVNFHYSLLPAFKGYIGMRSVKAALDAGCGFVGSTCHYVEQDVDGGKIISQCVTRCSKDDSFAFEKLQNVVFRANIVLVICYLLGQYDNLNNNPIPQEGGQNVLVLNGREVLFSPNLPLGFVNPDEMFWQRIKSL